MSVATVHNVFGRCLFFLLMTPAITYAQTAAEWNTRGAEAYDAGQWNDAAESFQKAYILSRDDATIRQNLVNSVIMNAQHLHQTGEAKQAIEWLEYVIKVDPENVRPLNQLGAYLMMNGNNSSAIFRLEESIELQPDDIDAHFLLGEAYYKDNDVSAAIDHWEWVYRVQPDYDGLQDRLETALREEQVVFDFQGDNSRNFHVTYSREAERQLVRDVLNILESAYKDVGRTLGGIYPPPPIQVSLYTSEGFFESTQLGQHVGALFDGTKIRCPVLDKNGKVIPMDVLRERLYHEYVHVVVHSVSKNNVPWWFNEGLAETLSTTISQHEIDILQKALNDNALYDYEEISAQDLLKSMSPKELELAYSQAHIAVTYLQRRYGERRMANMLDSLKAGFTGEDALRNAFGITYFTLRSEVRSLITEP